MTLTVVQVNHLRDDEISYELQIRNCSHTGTHEENLNVLRGLLEMETMGQTTVNSICYPEPIGDALACLEKLKEMSGMIMNFTNFSQLDTFVLELNSRLVALYLRITRLPPQFSSELLRVLSMVKSALSSLSPPVTTTPVTNLIDFDDVPTNSASVNPGPSDSTAPSLPMIWLSSLDEQCLRFQQKLDSLRFSNLHTTIPPVATAQLNLQSSPIIPRFVPSSTLLPRVSGCDHHTLVSKWNITFDGNSGLNQFLEKIESLSYSRGVSHAQLFRQAGDLFTGHALVWYRMIGPSVSSWSELVTKLRQTFLPANYDLALMDEIRSRTQASNERVEIFIAIMENLFSRLSKTLDEETRVNYIIRNLQPKFQRFCALQNIASLSELISICKRLEDTELQISKFKDPPTRTSYTLEPDLSCPPTYKPSSTFSKNSRPKIATLENTPVPNSKPTGRKMPACWNCNSTEHLYPKCPEDLGLFCFGCGRKNVTKSRCPKCSKNGYGGPSSSADAQNASEELEKSQKSLPKTTQ